MSRGGAALSIRTPEGVEFSYPLAGPFSRFLAWVVDLACVAAAGALVQGVAMAGFALSPDLARALALVGYFVLSVGYGMALELEWRGQTVGKRLLRLRVVDAGGLRLTAAQVVLRNLLRPVDSLPLAYGLGALTMLASPLRQRLGDLAAGTVVVYEPLAVLPPLAAVTPDKYNTLREHEHVAARVRQRIRPDEARLALTALLRRESLAPEARLAVFAELAARLRASAELDGELLAGVSDERLVRNVVDVVYRPRGG